jgi:hypothetical protein
MTWWHRSCFAAFLAFALIAPASSDEQAYRQAFVNEVVEFANRNRLNISRLHRDVHADCFLPVTVAAVILIDGTVKDISIVASSSVPVVDRYFRFVIEQAAPFPPLAAYFDPVPGQVTITHEFRLDVTLWSDGRRSERPCDRLQAPEAEERSIRNPDVGPDPGLSHYSPQLIGKRASARRFCIPLTSCN